MLRPKRFLSLKWRSTLSQSLSTQLGPNGHPPADLLGLQQGRRRPAPLHIPILDIQAVDGLYQASPSSITVLALPHVTPGAWMSILFHPALGTDLGEKQGPTWLPAQDSGVHSSCLAGPWLQAAPGGGGSPGVAGAAGELSHRAVYTGKRPRLG